MAEHTHTSLTVHLILRTAERLGAKRPEILSRAGLSESDVPMGPLPMPWEAVVRLTQAAIDLCPKGLLTFRAAVDMSVVEMGIVGAYQVQAPSYRASRAIIFDEAMRRYSTVTRMWLEEEGEWGRICAGLTPVAADEMANAAPQVHLFLGMHIKGLREFFGAETPVERLCLTATDGIDVAELSALLKCPVVLGQPVDCVVVQREIFDRELPLATPWLREQLRPQYEATLRLLDEGRVSTIAVRTVLETCLTRELPTELAGVAGILRTTARGLRLRLAAEGTTFSSELDVVRKEFTLRQLAYPGVKLAAIAALVGFSDPAAFTRAFRRWTGTPPTEWQARHAGPAN